jgi:hypothetical protein
MMENPGEISVLGLRGHNIASKRYTCYRESYLISLKTLTEVACGHCGCGCQHY